MNAVDTPVNYCLGDLFDSYTVDGLTLMQGNDIVKSCAFVLGGNHDFSNRMDTLSGLEVLMRLNPLRFESEYSRLWRASWAHFNEQGCQFFAIGHKLTQALFEESLNQVEAVANDFTLDTVLFLHCNYDSPYADNTSTLNLTKDRADRLLQSFNYIFIGHEHMPNTHFGGHLVLLGNTHPTSFSDISDKYRWEITLEEGRIKSVEPVQIWDKNKGYLALPAERLLAGGIEIPDSLQFLEVVGQAEAKDMPLIARNVAGLWRKSENLLMLKNSVICETTDLELKPLDSYEDIPTRITKGLEGTELHALWLEYLKRTENQTEV